MAKKEAMDLVELLLGLAGFGVIAAVCGAFASSKVTAQSADADEAWKKLDGVISFQLTFYRQSGNTHKVVQVNGTRSDVEAEILKTFNRAGIGNQYGIWTRGDAIDYKRAIHSHRGSNEGKKIGGCLVSAL
ncbi:MULTISPECIES: hypothetical protein [Aeromonas]|uniref:hypothetical protein n=1 Tax=Aeromonas TaxID=642 RepID=UPI00191D5A87|nr:hypothetical protein [Aeromonas dhakensis]MBL0600281.1 hypothetical protein [Aeromonas dhakensis]MBL0617793.1 hypothetical protein [Aeromonas dhakensis]